MSSVHVHSGWFSGSKTWCVFHNVKLSGEAESANKEAAKTFYPLLKQKIILVSSPYKWNSVMLDVDKLMKQNRKSRNRPNWVRKFSNLNRWGKMPWLMNGVRTMVLHLAKSKFGFLLAPHTKFKLIKVLNIIYLHRGGTMRERDIEI